MKPSHPYFRLRPGRVGPEVASQRRRNPPGPGTDDPFRFEKLVAMRRVLRQGALPGAQRVLDGGA